MTSLTEEILAFWFAGAENDPVAAAERANVWFGADPELDREIARRFSAVATDAAAGRLARWSSDARSALALVLLLDQFPRNLFRGRPEAFAQDASALAVSSAAVAAGHLPRLSPVGQAFLILPLQHAEDLSRQREGLRLYENLAAEVPPAWRPALVPWLDSARAHLAVIERFGRFPHRNAILGREPTAAEREYLAAGGETFGAKRS
ncbi:MAG: DUF924 family protein [Candidatus Binatia bacterium]